MLPKNADTVRNGACCGKLPLAVSYNMLFVQSRGKICLYGAILGQQICAIVTFRDFWVSVTTSRREHSGEQSLGGKLHVLRTWCFFGFHACAYGMQPFVRHM